MQVGRVAFGRPRQRGNLHSEKNPLSVPHRQILRVNITQPGPLSLQRNTEGSGLPCEGPDLGADVPEGQWDAHEMPTFATRVLGLNNCRKHCLLRAGLPPAQKQD